MTALRLKQQSFRVLNVDLHILNNRLVPLVDTVQDTRSSLRV